MLRQRLKHLDLRVVKTIRSDPLWTQIGELEQLNSLLLSLHQQIKVYLHHQSLPSLATMSILTEKKGEMAKSMGVNAETESTVGKTGQHQSVSGDSEGAETSNMRVEEGVGGSGREDRKQKESCIRQRIICIIEYYTKVEAELAVKLQSMTQLCPNENLMPNNHPLPYSKNESLEVLSLKEQVDKVIEECKQIQQQLRPTNSQTKLLSESESNDKKSLLTEMLRESQLLESQNQYEMNSPRKNAKRPMSEFNCVAGNGNVGTSNRRLLKQIDLSNYKIGGGGRQREKKVGARNCGQCSECAIF